MSNKLDEEDTVLVTTPYGTYVPPEHMVRELVLLDDGSPDPSCDAFKAITEWVDKQDALLVAEPMGNA